MAGEVVLTIIGNLAAAPELKFTPSGAGVSNFTVCSTPRSFDKNTSEWVDGEPLFLRCNAWRMLGENCAESFNKGDRVIVTGRLKQRSFETKEGEKRSVMEMDVDDIGHSVKFNVAKSTRAARSGGSQQRPAEDDPWGSAPPPPAGRGGGFDSEPPF